jgi:hypothetical protein
MTMTMAIDQLFIEDLIAEIDALIADVDPGPSDQLANLFLGLSAKGALQVGIELGHSVRAASDGEEGAYPAGEAEPPCSGSTLSRGSSVVLKHQTGVLSSTTRSMRPY